MHAKLPCLLDAAYCGYQRNVHLLDLDGHSRSYGHQHGDATADGVGVGEFPVVSTCLRALEKMIDRHHLERGYLQASLSELERRETLHGRCVNTERGPSTRGSWLGKTVFNDGQNTESTLAYWSIAKAYTIAIGKDNHGEQDEQGVKECKDFVRRPDRLRHFDASSGKECVR